MQRFIAPALLLCLLALLPACDGDTLPAVYTDGGGGPRDLSGGPRIDFSQRLDFSGLKPLDFSGFPPPDISIPGPADLLPPDDIRPPVRDIDVVVDLWGPPDLGVPGPDLATPPPAIRLAPPLYQGGSGSAARTIAALDIDGDGALDVGTASTDLAMVMAIKGGGWMAPLDVPLAAGTHAAAFADFDGDKKIDAAVTISNNNSLVMLMGNGDGSFTPGPSFIVGVGPLWVLTEDFNGDGKADLATANGNDNTVSVLLGNGDGTFAAPAAYKANNGTRAIATGDFNGDKKIDIAAINGTSSDVSVFLGAGNGTMGPATHYVTGPAPIAIATADFNADGRSDIVTVSGFPGSAVVLLASQNGFNAGLSYMVGNAAGGVCTGDWNGDKFPDFAVSSGSTLPATVIPFIGNGKNNFVASAPVAVMSTTSAGTLTSADMNLDGKADILAATGEGAATLLTNDGAGNFAASLVPATVGNGFAYPGDINNDGKPDVVGYLASGQIANVSALTGNGTGRMVAGGRYPLPAGGYLALGDVNGDKNLDVVLMPSSNVAGASLLGNGNATFQQAMNDGVTATFTSVGALGDFDGDGRLDLVGAGFNQPQIYMGLGTGAFKAGVALGAVNMIYNPLTGDWNGDKALDVLGPSQFNPNGAVLFTNKGNGTFSATNVVAGQNPTVAAKGDFNGDGLLDFALGGATNIAVLLGRQGGFTAPVTYGANISLRWLAAADLNNDGRVDLACAAGTTGINVFAGNGDGTFLPAVILPLAHSATMLQVADLNGDNKPDLISTGTGGPWLAVLINQAK